MISSLVESIEILASISKEIRQPQCNKMSAFVSFQVSFCVPSGAAGHVTAGLIAQAMGLPVFKLAMATNANAGKEKNKNNYLYWKESEMLKHPYCFGFETVVPVHTIPMAFAHKFQDYMPWCPREFSSVQAKSRRQQAMPWTFKCVKPNHSSPFSNLFIYPSPGHIPV